MIALDYKHLLEYLLKKKYQASFQDETNQLCVVFKIDQKEFPLFIRIPEEGELLQMVTFIPQNARPTTIADVSRLLHMFNRELDLPGFGLNEETGHIFFRCAIPCVDKKVDENVLEAFLSSSQVVCKSFSPAIDAIAEGAITFDALLKKAKEAK